MWGIDLPLRCCEADRRGFLSSGLAACLQQERMPLPTSPWRCSVARLAASDHREHAAEGVPALRELPGSLGAVAGALPVAWGRGRGLQGSALPWLLVALCPLAFLTLSSPAGLHLPTV